MNLAKYVSIMRIIIANIYQVLSGHQLWCWELVKYMLLYLIFTIILWGSRNPVFQGGKRSSENWVELKVNDWAGVWNQSPSFKLLYSMVFNNSIFTRNWTARAVSRAAVMLNSQDIPLPLPSVSHPWNGTGHGIHSLRDSPGCQSEGKGHPWQTSHQKGYAWCTVSC